MTLTTRLPSARLRACLLRLPALLLVSLAGLAVASASASAQAPPAPTFSNQLSDCVTGDNQFYNSGTGTLHWPVNQGLGANGHTNSFKCDSYQNDVYERPTNAGFADRVITQRPSSLSGNAPFSYTLAPGITPDLSGLPPDPEYVNGSTTFATTGDYFEYADITRASAGFQDVNVTNGWLFLRIEVFGDQLVSKSGAQSGDFGASTYYNARIASNASANNAKSGLLLRNELQSDMKTVSSTWTAEKAEIFADTNADVGGAAVNQTASQGDSSGNAYDTPRSNKDVGKQWLWVRRPANQPFSTPSGGSASRPVVELAFNYKRYNAQFGTNFLPSNITYLDLETTKGLQSNSNYLWNDKYTLNQAGSPNKTEDPGGDTGPENIYELDSMRLGGFPTTGKLEVRKTLSPAADLGKFDLQIDGVTDPDADGIGDGGSTGEQTLPTGNHTVGETAGDGTTNLDDYQKQISCIDTAAGNAPAGSAGPDNGGPLNVNVTAGSDIVCTITNTREKGSLEVRKVVDPTTDLGKFDLFIKQGATTVDSAADQMHGGTTGQNSVNTGTYEVSETGGAGTDLNDYQQSLACVDQNQDPVASPGGSVVVAHNKDVVCTFTNVREKGSLEVRKAVDPTTDPGKFDLFIKQGATTVDSAADQMHGGTTGQNSVNTGTYEVSETGGTGTDLNDYQQSLACVDQNQDPVASPGGSVVVAHNKDVVCTFTNIRETGTIKVTKVTDPAGLADSFGFTPTAFGAGAFNLTHGQTQTFTDVPTDTSGALKVAEGTVTGFRLVDIACDDNDSTDRSSNGGLNGADREASIKLSHNETVECVFTNRQITSSTVIVKAGNEFAYHGDTVTYTFDVTNGGGGPLHDVVVTDDRCAPLSGPDKGSDATPATLDPGDTWKYTCTRPVPEHSEGEENPMVNTATVTAKDEFDRTVTDTDPHSTVIRHPSVAIDKTGPVSATAGELIDFTMTVTNPGDRPLFNVDVTDPRCTAKPTLQAKNRGGGTDPTPDTLDPGDAWVFVCSGQSQAGESEFANTATVTATDGGRDVTASDSHTTPLATQQILGQRVSPGTARLAGATGCRARPFTVRVKGRSILRVEFSIDGKKRKTVTRPDSANRWIYKIDPRKFKPGSHRVAARAVFSRDSGTRPKTMRMRFSRCVRAAQAPAFTG